jgi:plastocyanin
LRRIVTTALALATAGLVAAAVSFAAPQRAVTLRGSVGPGFTINLTKNGKKVRTLRPGTYRFVIADRSSAHNFVLEKEHGGRFERELTHVGAVGTKTVTVRLTRGTWKYYCEPHQSVMAGFFRVA